MILNLSNVGPNFDFHSAANCRGPNPGGGLGRLGFLSAAWPGGNKSAIGVPGCISRIQWWELWVKEFLRTLWLRNQL